jgi:hypothetical protein
MQGEQNTMLSSKAIKKISGFFLGPFLGTGRDVILAFVRRPAHDLPFLFGHFSNGQCQCRCSAAAAADAVWSAAVWGPSVVAIPQL